MAAQIRIGGAGGVGDAFHQVAQGLSRVQEALRLQEQEAQRRLQEAVRLQEERAATALRQMEQQLRERDNAISALRHSLDERVQRLEARVAAVEQQVRTSSARRQSETARWEVGLLEHDYAARTLQIEPVEKTLRPSSERRESEGALVQLESRMGKLEGAVQRALAGVFPRVEALVERLETSPPGAPLSPAASTSSAPQPPAASVALGASVVGKAAADDVNRLRQPRRRKLAKVEQRVKEVERRMLRSRASPSHLGEALCKATNPEEVRRLLDSGADANYTNTVGKCPLISAIALLSNKDLCDEVPGIVRLLVARGADANSIDLNGMSALHLAIERRLREDDFFDDVSDRQCLDLLIAAGADVNVRNFDGATPLHLAAEHDDELAVRSLLAAGANKRLRGWNSIYMNKKPCDIATMDEVVEYLYYN